LESQAELIRVASECTYVFSDVRGHPIPSFLVQENEFKDLEKPDGLCFVRRAEIQSSRARLITARSSVLILYKGAWKRKGTLSGALR
jgi:hypothetical protein